MGIRKKPVETNLYYLNSRYYDPEVCRFISMDSIEYMNPDTINGLNLYAYCNNNPVMNVDPEGNFPFLSGLIPLAILLFTSLGGTLTQVAVSAASYVGIGVASIFNETIRKDMNEIGWNPFNADEQKVLKSKCVSFYKGMAVYRTNLGRSDTFYAMFLANYENVTVVQHERGHGYQSMMMGIGTYGFTVCISSPLKLGKWYRAGEYYNSPWETMADILGGAKGNSHSKGEIITAWEYYAVSKLFFPYTISYWF